MKWKTSAVADATGGELHGPDVEVDGVAIDSRVVQGGELFVPLVARRDGHDFIDDALAAGAAAHVTARSPGDGTAVVVDDTFEALRALAVDARAQLPERVVAVTGSLGKTSTKDFLAEVLGRRWPTSASPRSFNNELGVSMALCNAAADAEAVVLEMGARGQGEVAALAALARPLVGIVTCVAAVHTATFGSLDDVARSKRELVEVLPANGAAVLNALDTHVAAMATRTNAQVVRFAACSSGRGAEDSDVVAETVTVDDELRPRFVLRSAWGSTPVHLGARGEHHVVNAVAAAAAALALGVGLDEVAQGLEKATLSRWRMELRRAHSGALILNDAYNASPMSTAAALRALAALEARRRVAVLGPMAELGARATDEHRAIGALASELGIRVVAVGAPEYGAEDVRDVEQAVAALDALGAGDAVLVKGSRVAALERVAFALLGEALVPEDGSA